MSSLKPVIYKKKCGCERNYQRYDWKWYVNFKKVNSIITFIAKFHADSSFIYKNSFLYETDIEGN